MQMHWSIQSGTCIQWTHVYECIGVYKGKPVYSGHVYVNQWTHVYECIGVYRGKPVYSGHMYANVLEYTKWDLCKVDTSTTSVGPV